MMFNNKRLDDIHFLLKEINLKENYIMDAILDLTTSIDALSTAVTTEVTALTAAIAAEGIDQSPAIETQVARVNAATAALSASVTPPVA